MSTDATSPPVEVYEATRLGGPTGAVQRGDSPLEDNAAVERLKAAEDIVACSANRRANRNKARQLTERAFGGFEEDQPHQGRMSLPHFHPARRTPDVHAFYEAPPRHARKRKKP